MRTWEESLHERLAASEEYAVGYLSAALEENHTPTFLLALRHVAEARGGLDALAQKTGFDQTSLDRLLSGIGTPQLDSLQEILAALGIQITFTVKKAA